MPPSQLLLIFPWQSTAVLHLLQEATVPLIDAKHKKIFVKFITKRTVLMTISSSCFAGFIPIKLFPEKLWFVSHSTPHISRNRLIINDNKSRDVSLIFSESTLNSRAIKDSLAAFFHIRSEFLLTFVHRKWHTTTKAAKEKKNYNIIKCFHAKQMIHHSTVLVSSLLFLLIFISRSNNSRKVLILFVSIRRWSKAETKDRNWSPPTSHCLLLSAPH